MRYGTARTCMLVLLVLLLVFGISMLYSTSFTVYEEFFLKRQILWVGVGAAFAFLIRSVDYRLLTKYAWVALIACSAALAYLAFAYFVYKLDLLPQSLFSKIPFIPDRPTKGSFRWLRFPGFSLQPSEFAKPLLIMVLADYLGRRARHLDDVRRGFLIPTGIIGGVLFLILAGKDLSSTVIAGAIAYAMMFIAGVRLKYLILIGLAGLLATGVMIKISPERVRRFTVYRNPEPYRDAEGYQLWQAQLALGSGGLTGIGFTKSRLKHRYLPEAHTDFIVAIIGEELGFLSVVGLVALYAFLVGSVFWIASQAEDRQGVLLCAGVGLNIAFQALINISVVSGFCPTTGVTAPFLSYGGSSMIASLIGIGLVLSVSRRSERDFMTREAQTRYGTNFDTVEQPALP